MNRLSSGAVGLVLALLLVGCASSPESPRGPVYPEPTRHAAEPVEDMAARDAMWRHAQSVWPEVRDKMTSADLSEPAAKDDVAGSVMGTPTLMWDYESSLPTDSSPWLGLVPQSDRVIYVIPVLKDGAPIGTLMTHNYSGSWRVWPISASLSAKTQAARDQLADFLGGEFTWYYVDNGGTWVIARRGEKVAGVFVDPTLDHRTDDPPAGVLAGTELRRAMDQPLGPSR